MTKEELEAAEAFVAKYIPKAALEFKPDGKSFRVILELDDGPSLGDLLRELDRFREREPLVQKLLGSCNSVMEWDDAAIDVQFAEAIKAVREFKL